MRESYDTHEWVIPYTWMGWDTLILREWTCVCVYLYIWHDSIRMHTHTHTHMKKPRHSHTLHNSCMWECHDSFMCVSVCVYIHIESSHTHERIATRMSPIWMRHVMVTYIYRRAPYILILTCIYTYIYIYEYIQIYIHMLLFYIYMYTRYILYTYIYIWICLNIYTYAALPFPVRGCK